MSLLISVLLCAAAPAEVKIAMPGLTSVNLDAKTADLYSDYFAQKLAEAGHFRVSTRSEVGALLGFERQKQLLGCSDSSSSCLAELAGALGVDGIVVGNLGKLGREYVVTLKIIDASNGSVLASASSRVGDEQALLDWMATTAQVMSKAVRERLHRPDAEAEPGATVRVTSTQTSLRSRTWVPAVAAGALVIAGIVFYGVAWSIDESLRTGRNTYPDAPTLDGAVGRGKAFQTIAFVAFGTAIAAALVSAGFYVFGGESASPVTLVPTSNGLGVVGTFR
jgi:hypothetical protein